MAGEGEDLIDVRVGRSDGPRCPRCRFHHTVRGNFDDLCDRCCRVILEGFPGHWSAAGIREANRRWSVKAP